MIVREISPASDRFASRGITLLESIVAVVIVGIIAWVAIPRLWENSFDSKTNACYVNVANIEVQAELWYRNKGSWPAPDLSDLSADNEYFPDGLGLCPVDGTGYTLDGTTHRVTGHEHASP
jgi:prepilin-type N-terminal cleavage/methylation domain-containing protein